jgi:hypothetical protein
MGETIMSLQSTIYKILRIWNDVDAVRKGRVGKRIGRRVVGRVSGKSLRKLFK